MIGSALVLLSLLSLRADLSSFEPWFSTRGLAVAAAVLSTSRESPMPARLEERGRPLVGARFFLSPLGEGELGHEEHEDHDPRLRFDAFDCTTFVETSMALAVVNAPWSTRRELDSIRYRGEPSFLHRRHFPEQEWLPDLRAEHRLRDVTRELGGSLTQRRIKHFDERVWSRRRYAGELVLPISRLPKGEVSLDVLPLDEARSSWSRWPSGLLVNVVRVDGPGVPVIVAHQGIFFRFDDGRAVVRHAAFPPIGRVIDEPVEQFLSRVGRLKTYEVDGLNLCEILDPTTTR
ncbi:MAG: DUF1460 domain-containing protein [Polyangiaceae bacterium]